MSSAPIHDIDLATFNIDPYPVLDLLRNNSQLPTCRS